MSEKTAIEFYNEDVRGTYTPADLEQARKQGAEDERAQCIEDFEALLDAIRERIKDDKETFHNCGHDVKGHFRAIMLFDECRERWVQERSKALGPIGETREETERRVRQEWVDAARAYRELTVCYRVGKRPTEKLFAALRKADALLDAIRALGGKA